MKRKKLLIFEKLTKAGLKKKEEFQRFKSWVFEWPEWHKAIRAEKFCDELPTLSSLDYCEPDYLLGPASEPHSEPESKVEPVSQSADQPAYPEVPPGQENIRNCNIVSHGLNVHYMYPETKCQSKSCILPTYWAQEMIGADLLREKLKKAKPVEKHLVAVFDGPPGSFHATGVRNLISGEGKQAVLPELGNRISKRDGSRSLFYLRHRNNLLNKVQNICGDGNNSNDSGAKFYHDADLTLFAFLLLSNSAEARRKKKRPKPSTEEYKSEQTSPIVADDDPYKQCKATALPSFINNSMYWSPSYTNNKAGKTEYDAFKSLSPPSILVLGAGNGYDTPLLPYEAKASKDFDTIIVGSLTPRGIRSGFFPTGGGSAYHGPGRLRADYC